MLAQSPRLEDRCPRRRMPSGSELVIVIVPLIVTLVSIPGFSMNDLLPASPTFRINQAPNEYVWGGTADIYSC